MIRLLRIIPFLFFVFCLNSCIVIYNTGQTKPETKGIVCGVFTLPIQPPLPTVPVIPTTLSKNKEATDDILLASIQAHRQYIREYQTRLNESLLAYQSTCH